MNTIQIDIDVADDLRYMSDDEFKHITAIRGEEHRWYWEMVTIIQSKDSGLFYGFHWIEDKSEMGDLDPFEYSKGGNGFIEAVEYKPVTKTIVDYVPA
jgi:hypothetical protein